MGLDGSTSALLQGTERLVVEPGARVVLVKRWRDAFPNASWSVLPWPVLNPNCLAAFPPEPWKARLDKVAMADKYGVSLKSKAQIKKRMTMTVHDLALDRSGRLCLGGILADAIQLQDVAMAAGCEDHIEIYTPEEFDRLPDVFRQTVTPEDLEALEL